MQRAKDQKQEIIWRGACLPQAGRQTKERRLEGSGVVVSSGQMLGHAKGVQGAPNICWEKIEKKEIIWRGVAKLKGFTLVELLVVFAIIVILIGITFGFVSKMKARNWAVVCELNLKTIGQALRMYRLDEGAYPPFDPVDKPNDPGFGLWALFDQGYIHSPRVLHCSQADATRKPQPYVRFDPLFPYKRQNGYNSYQDVEDPDTGEWRYLPYRGVPYDPSNPPVPGSDVYRQLEAYDTVGNKISNWHPQDNTIVTWCPFHRRVIKKAGVPQDIVLFLDGTVQRLDAPVSWTTLPKE